MHAYMHIHTPPKTALLVFQHSFIVVSFGIRSGAWWCMMMHDDAAQWCMAAYPIWTTICVVITSFFFTALMICIWSIGSHHACMCRKIYTSIHITHIYLAQCLHRCTLDSRFLSFGPEYSQGYTAQKCQDTDDLYMYILKGDFEIETSSWAGISLHTFQLQQCL